MIKGVWENGIFTQVVNGKTCTFDEREHKYRIEGVHVPGVTTVLRSMGFIDDRFWNQDALLRGQYFHTATEFYDQGDLDIEDQDPTLIPYLRGYPKFLEENEVEIIHSEIVLFNTDFWVAGRLDRIAWMRLPKWPKRKKCLIDYKSGGYSDWCELQTGGYEALARALGIVKPDEYLPRFGVQFPGNENYRLHPHEDRNDKDLFMSLVAGTHWKRNHQTKEDGYGTSIETYRVA